MTVNRSWKILTALVPLLVAAPAAAIEVDFEVDTETVILDSSPWVEFFGTVMGGPGVDEDVVVHGMMPPGFDIQDVELWPGVVAGEMSWNTDNDTRLLSFNIDGDRLADLPITLVGLPEPGQPCGFYGMDFDPTTGHYFAFIGIQPPGLNDGGNKCYYASSIRDLFEIDPETGVAIWLGSMPVKFNDMSIAPDGRIFGQAANGATQRGAIYEVGRDGSVTLISKSPISSTRVTWNSPTTFAFNPEDGLIYQTGDDEINSDGCMLGVIDPDSKSIVFEDMPINDGDCPEDDHHGMTYVGDSGFIVLDWEDMALLENNDGTWEWTYLDDLDDDVRGIVGAGGDRTFDYDCTYVGREFTCTVGRLIPRGAIQIFVGGDYNATQVGQFTATIDTSSQSGSDMQSFLFNVVAADLASFASADAARVDVGDTIEYTVEVENIGTRSTNTSAVIDVPSNVTYVGYTTTQGSCSWNGNVLNCSFGTIGAGNLVRVRVETTAASDGVAELTVDASGTLGETTLANNFASARVIVGAAVDLIVGAGLGAPAGAPAVVQPGSAVPVTFTVYNAGPDDAVDVSLTHYVPAGFELDGADADAGDCAVDAGVLTCDLGDIAAGTTVTVDLAPTPVSAGSFVFSAAATAVSPPEMAPGNNAASVAVVVAPPSLTVELGTGGLLGLVVTHGGETSQELAVRSLTVQAAALNIEGNVRVRIVHDVDGNGRADAGEQTVGDLTLDLSGNEVVVPLRGLTLAKGESAKLIVIAVDGGATTARVAGGTMVAALGLLPFVGLVGLRRRRAGILVVALAAGLTLPGCGDLLDELLRGRVQIVVTDVDAGLKSAKDSDSAVEGLPIEGPLAEVK